MNNSRGASEGTSGALLRQLNLLVEAPI